MPANPSDLSVIIPTRDRWAVLGRTLQALRQQTVQGFEVVVVVDGNDQRIPSLEGVRTLTIDHGGPGMARNAGVDATAKPLVLFLGDDMIAESTLVEEHLAFHSLRPEAVYALLGHVVWHPEVAGSRYNRWLTNSGSQFDFPRSDPAPPAHPERGPTPITEPETILVHTEAGSSRFYSCNVSMKRSLFADAGGFDPRFDYYYEDLDLGYRLGERGMRLLFEPAARCEHLHRYDWPGLRSRLRGVGAGEQTMAEIHEWFSPHFLNRFSSALDCPEPSEWWPLIEDLVARCARRAPWIGRRLHPVSTLASARSDIWYRRRLADAFLAGWWASSDLEELRAYLGDSFDRSLLVGHEAAVAAERANYGDELSFYRASTSYLYDLTAFSMSATKAPYLAAFRSLLRSGGRVLDYGCGIGADGLRLMTDGFDVSFADFDCPATDFLRWRLERRGWDANVFDVDRDAIPTSFDAVYAFDVIEHVEDPFGFLDKLEGLAALAVVNFLDDDSTEGRGNHAGLHRPLAVSALLESVAKRGLVHYRLHHGRSHLVAYRGKGGSPGGVSFGAVSRLRSSLELRFGRWMPRETGWFPVPRKVARVTVGAR